MGPIKGQVTAGLAFLTPFAIKEKIQRRGTTTGTRPPPALRRGMGHDPAAGPGPRGPLAGPAAGGGGGAGRDAGRDGRGRERPDPLDSAARAPHAHERAALVLRGGRRTLPA